jgi:NAD(P)H dehydrogenase (quinone)
MSKVLVCYYSRSGNTEKMANIIAGAIEQEEGISVSLKRVEDTQPEELLEYEGLIFGSPTYYGSMAWQMKKLLDESVAFHGQLSGKVGAAFTSAANLGGGNETTIMDILKAFLIHGMIIQGDPMGDHYGPVAMEAPDKRASRECERLGHRIARLVKMGS